MHEFSLMQGILDSIEPVARQNHATKINSINLDVGIMTQVVKECMDFAFEVLTEKSPLYEGCSLSLNFIEPKSRCLDCGCEFEHDRFHRRCPRCKSAATTLLQGRELKIASIEVDIPEQNEDARTEAESAWATHGGKA